MTTALTVSDNGDEFMSVSLGGGITLTATGAIIEGEPTMDEFCTAVQNCYSLANATMWAIGDLLLYGEGRGEWGEAYTQAVELTQKSYASLTQAVWVSKAYPQKDREFASALSWSHHRAAARIKDLDERRQLLQQCVDKALSHDELKAIIPKELPVGETPTSEEGEPHDVTCPFCQRSFAL